ncbi:hypothetical protein L484_027291 [Morus notabilis]|uniref:Serine aminopeptidase S33 domain-containing protein n=1 Tax=Morus notabilis TaxID=981085 RepID=W9R611_9ROSA|nr:hypothetical protein L484_027291 [Morus notabilis]
MAQAAENPVVQQKRLIIPNKYGEKLVGLLHDTGSVEIVILCHGFQATKEYRIMTNVAGALEKEGISAFRLDFSGNGESEGTFECGNYKKEADDLHAVIEHFSGANHVISGILGHSKVKDSRIMMRDLQITKKRKKPSDLTSSVGHGAVLSFSRRS